mgnify:FL=1
MGETVVLAIKEMLIYLIRCKEKHIFEAGGLGSAPTYQHGQREHLRLLLYGGFYVDQGVFFLGPVGAGAGGKIDGGVAQGV